MPSIPSQKKSLLFECLFLVVLSAALAGGMNFVSPSALPWLGSGVPAPAEADAGSAVETMSEINVERAMELFAANEAVFVDARLFDDYAFGHIPGAVNIPPGMFEDQIAAALSPDAVQGRPLVVYCSSPSCPLSHELALGLEFLGYDNVMIFAGGWQHWTEAGGEAEVAQ